MVATLLRLRFLVLRNTLARSAWTIVATILGGLYAVGVLVGVVIGLAALGAFATVEWISIVVVLAGAATVAGWVLLPLLLTGVDQTLDAPRLAQFPLSPRTLLVALTAAGVLGIPGIVTSLAALATVLAWLQHPLALVAAPFSAALGVLTAVVGSRAVTSASTSWRSNRRAREVSTIALLIPLMLLGPVILLVTQGLGGSTESLPAAADVLGWTPLGAAWAIPGAIAVGDPLGAALRLGIAAATLAVLVAVWRVALLHSLESPARASSGSRGRAGLGPFGWVPQTPAGAVMARSLVYWRRDPRFLQQLILVPLIPLLFWFYANLNDAPLLLLASGPAVGLALSGVLAVIVSYDGTAFATHVMDGVRGIDDRLGRFAAVVLFAVPITLVMVVGTAVVGQRLDLAAPLLGVSLGVLLTGLGVGSVSSARFVVPVPAPGANPFKAPPGQGFTTGVKSLGIFGVTALLSLPTVVLGIVALVTGSAAFGWATLAVGLALGIVIAVVGVRVGGAVLDRTAPVLLADLRRMRTA